MLDGQLGEGVPSRGDSMDKGLVRSLVLATSSRSEWPEARKWGDEGGASSPYLKGLIKVFT